MIACTVKIRAGKRTYLVPGQIPSDAPTAAEKQAAGAAALAALVASAGAGFGYTDAEPDWAGAVAQSIAWTKDVNL